MELTQLAKKVAKYIYKHSPYAQSIKFMSTGCEVEFKVLYTGLEKYFNVNITGYTNKIRINIIEESDLEPTVSSKTYNAIIFEEDMVDATFDVMEDIDNSIEKYILETY